MVFVNGIPEQINRTQFRLKFGANFPDLLQSDFDDLIDECIDDVYVMFVGVGSFWNRQDETTYYKKTQLCYNLLLAWYIADMYPIYAVGIVSSGGIPIKSKSIGGVKVVFGTPDGEGFGKNKIYRDALIQLRSNAFGNKAYMMLKNASGNYSIIGRLK